MSILETLQFCALHGISVLFQKPPEGEEALVVELPGRVPSVSGQLRLENVCEIVFAGRTENNTRAEWHVLASPDLVQDAAAFEEVFRRGFETFCRLVRIEARPPTLWGRPVVRMEVKDIDLRPLRLLAENRLADWTRYAGVDWAKKEEEE